METGKKVVKTDWLFGFKRAVLEETLNFNGKKYRISTFPNGCSFPNPGPRVIVCNDQQFPNASNSLHNVQMYIPDVAGGKGPVIEYSAPNSCASLWAFMAFAEDLVNDPAANQLTEDQQRRSHQRFVDGEGKCGNQMCAECVYSKLRCNSELACGATENAKLAARVFESQAWLDAHITNEQILNETAVEFCKRMIRTNGAGRCGPKKCDRCCLFTGIRKSPGACTPTDALSAAVKYLQKLDQIGKQPKEPDLDIIDVLEKKLEGISKMIAGERERRNAIKEKIDGEVSNLQNEVSKYGNQAR